MTRLLKTMTSTTTTTTMMMMIGWIVFGVFLDLVHSGESGIKLQMPGARPLQDDTYLCTTMMIDQTSNKPKFITEFQPKVSTKHAHHMLLFGCAEPGSDKPIWQCGEMKSSDANRHEGRVCRTGAEKILFAWAMEGKTFELPDDTGFMIGDGAGFRYLVLQIHYKNTGDFQTNPGLVDSSGLFLGTTENPPRKIAGIYLLVTNGEIPAKSTVFLETACLYSGSVPLHPFAFRVHTHKHGKLVTAFDIHQGKWHEIGRMDPQKPQLFYPVVNQSLLIQTNDRIAARCVMRNDGETTVFIGSTMKSEMCNFYMMYWVPYSEKHAILGQGRSGNSPRAPGQSDPAVCFSPGWPFYKWNTNFDVTGEPKSAAQLPGTTNGRMFREQTSTVLTNHDGGGGSRRTSGSGVGRETGPNKLENTAFNWQSRMDSSPDGRASSSQFESNQNSFGLYVNGEPFVAPPPPPSELPANQNTAGSVDKRSANPNAGNADVDHGEEEEEDSDDSDVADEEEEDEGNEEEEDPEGDEEFETPNAKSGKSQTSDQNPGRHDDDDDDDEDDDEEEASPDDEKFEDESNSNPFDFGVNQN